MPPRKACLMAPCRVRLTGSQFHKGDPSMPLRLAAFAFLLTLAGCATPPDAGTVTDVTTTSDPVSGEEFVCVTTSYDLTECSPAGDVQPAAP